MTVNFAPDKEFEQLIEDHKKLGYPTKTALLNDALKLFKREKAKELRAQWRKEAFLSYARTPPEQVFKTIEGDEFEDL